jgi:anti-sigma regulatory factor (Ser/Thr protein kinase)/ABC-type transporter Mla MlaB component
MERRMERRLLTLQEAAELLHISKTTFNKIRKDAGFSEVIVGKRARFYEDELLAALPRAERQKEGRVANTASANAALAVPLASPLSRSFSATGQSESQTKVSTAASLELTLFTNDSLENLEVSPNVLDLSRIARIDVFGALSLLCLIIQKSKGAEQINLLVKDGAVAQKLKAFHFFYHLESFCGAKVRWDRSEFGVESFSDSSRILPIRAIRSMGGEKQILDDLTSSLKNHGVSAALIRDLALIIEELAENTMTHSAERLIDRAAFVTVQRVLLDGRQGVALAFADAGCGIHQSIQKCIQKSARIENQEHGPLGDVAALQKALSKRDSQSTQSGLPGVLEIILKWNAVAEIESGPVAIALQRDQRQKAKFGSRSPLTKVGGTRFGMILFDEAQN